MIIIFGTKTRKTTLSPDKLIHACPGCGGDLERREYKTWLTLFWIPIFPVRNRGGFYTCNHCSSTFTETDRQILEEHAEQKTMSTENGDKLYACTLTACMINLATANGRGALDKENEIGNIKSMFPIWTKEIDETILLVLSAKEPELEVHTLLRACTKVLPKQSVWELLKICSDNLRCHDCPTPTHIKMLEEYLLVSGFEKSDMNKLLPENILV